MIALVSFPLVDMVLFRDKWYRCLFCGVAAVLIMSAADMISAAVLLTPEQLRQGLTFQPIPVQLTVLRHLPVGIGIFPVDVHPADEPL
ncbi:MAG: hypothetical protein ACLR5H_10920 [Oscillospiraceae bacterium]